MRKLSWSAVEGDVGELAGGWVALASSADGPVLWCGGEQHAPLGIAPRYLAKDAFTALRDGQLQQDGTLAWNGQGWRLADAAEGGRLVARLVAEGTAP